MRSNHSSIKLSLGERALSQANATSRSNAANFGMTYANIYDVLYRDKNYTAEAQFVLEQLRLVIPQAPRRILDLGCGTGRHAVQMAETGISVTGVDRSAAAVAIANNRKKSSPQDVGGRLDFRVGDICTINFNRRYDAVTSLFHVMSYLVDDHDLIAAFQIVRHHLRKGGAFLFDFWYGPAVLKDPPEQRIKTTQVGNSAIQRKTIPEWEPKRNVVRVNYDIEIRNVANGETIREREQHVVRYFFLDEIQKRLEGCGFEVVHIAQWMTGRRPSDNTFSVYALAKVK
jgi:SAM-dependent methyltransferase